jgi:hypothetical protein
LYHKLKMTLLNYETVKNKLLAPCQFHQKLFEVFIMILWFEKKNVIICLWKLAKDNQLFSNVWKPILWKLA